MTRTEVMSSSFAQLYGNPPAMKLCQLCRGAGTLLDRLLKYWPCPCCDGQGVNATSITRPTLKVRTR